MTDKELRRLGRKDLLEVLLEQTKKTSELQDRVKVLEAQLEDKRIKVSNSGSMAEAALVLNNLLADADRSAAQYLENIRLNEAESIRTLEEAKKQAEIIIKEAETIREEKMKEADEYMNEVRKNVQLLSEEHPELGRTVNEECQGE